MSVSSMSAPSLTRYQNRVTELISSERAQTCGPQSRELYQRFHAYRFGKTLEACTRYVPAGAARVLDVGRSALTGMLAETYRDVTTLGLSLHQDTGGHREAEGIPSAVPHIEFDLNRSAEVPSWPRDSSGFDLIVYSETVEHIHIAPELSLLMLGSLLKPDGKLLVSTPNAVRLANRRRMLRGMNPFERIRYFEQNPGHFREYTASELRQMATDALLRCIAVEQIDFYRRGRQRIVPSWRDSLIAVYVRSEQRGAL